MRVAIGSDHAGFEYKNAIKEFLTKMGFETLDLGTNSSEAADYPDHAVAVAKAVQNKEADFGVLICGTGIGMSIAANKVKGIRAALVTSEFTANSSKTHNHANVITFGSRVNTISEVLRFLEVFIKTPESKERRHEIRVEKIGKFEEENE